MLLGSCGGPAAVSCPQPGLPSPSPTYVATIESLVVTPARAHLRDASEVEADSFTGFVAELQEACAQAPPGGDCELTHLRSELTSLPAPGHPTLFTDIDGSLDAALANAHGSFVPADRDCDGQSEPVCDARAVTGAFARAACELGLVDDEEGHP